MADARDDDLESIECPQCHGLGYVSGDPEGSPTEGCDLCGDGCGRIYELPSLPTGKTPTEEHNEWDALRTLAHKPK